MTIKPTAPTLLPTDDFVTHHGQKSKTFAEPPLDGTLNLPMLVDWHGDKSATHTWAVYPLPDGSLQHVTWRHLQGAMHQRVNLLTFTPFECEMLKQGAIVLSQSREAYKTTLAVCNSRKRSSSGSCSRKSRHHVRRQHTKHVCNKHIQIGTY